ncbi:MAG: hypothetical protein HZY76_00295 [Anaerolineae bacterium]|nr:MAG: hypothetical protein HZY76_00295 [Anaerolineae bacterium]
MFSDTSGTRDIQETADSTQEAVSAKPLDPTGTKAMQGEVANTDTPLLFGTFAHEAYENAAEEIR